MIGWPPLLIMIVAFYKERHGNIELRRNTNAVDIFFSDFICTFAWTNSFLSGRFDEQIQIAFLKPYLGNIDVKIANRMFLKAFNRSMD
ncbi:MAG: hypothetical protein LM517_10200 [Nitrosomonas sp.]|nr:hypothetical protein [Nitrosomonas sp.]